MARSWQPPSKVRTPPPLSHTLTHTRVRTYTHYPLCFCTHESIIPSLYGEMSGEEVVNDLLRFGTKVSDWRRNCRHRSCVDDKVRLHQHGVAFWWRGKTDGVKENGWGVLLWRVASFCFSLHPRPSLYPDWQTSSPSVSTQGQQWWL